MPFHYLETLVNREGYKDYCRDHKLNPNRCVFVFPSTSTFQRNPNLFSIKKGSGMAKVAAELGEAGYATLMLPLAVKGDSKGLSLINEAIMDLYRAHGAGYDLVVPVNKEGGEGCFVDWRELSPSEIEASPSLSEGGYITFLANLSEFLNTPGSKKNEALENNLEEELEGKFEDTFSQIDKRCYAKAYREGKKKQPLYWFDPVILLKPFPPFPESYSALYDKGSSPLESARNLLNDYTKNYSRIIRFFCGHWNRHHIKAVHSIVKEIDNGDIKSIEELISKLSFIRDLEFNFNLTGSLAKRIKFIEEQQSPLTQLFS